MHTGTRVRLDVLGVKADVKNNRHPRQGRVATNFMDQKTNTPSSRTLNYYQLFKHHSMYVDECRRLGIAPDISKITTGDDIIDAMDLDALIAHEHLKLLPATRKSYNLRFNILAQIAAIERSSHLLARRRAKAEAVYSRGQFSRRPNHESSMKKSTFFTESRIQEGKPIPKGRHCRRKDKISRQNARVFSFPKRMLYTSTLPDMVTYDKFISHQIHGKHYIFTESGMANEESAVMNVGGESAAQTTMENLIDIGTEPLDVNNDVGVSISDLPDGCNNTFKLDDFFARPVRIYSDTWDLDTDYDIHLDVWDLWSKNAAVRAKLSNYAFFRGTLHVKIAFSGSPYHYGRAMASYQPFPLSNETLRAYDQLHNRLSTLAGSNVITNVYKNYLSQAPGVVFHDYKTNLPCECVIPFINHKQRFRLFNGNGTVVTNATSFTDFLDAGQLRLCTLNRLKDATDDASTTAPVVIYVWMTDVQLSSPTATDIDITAESNIIWTESSVSDEYSRPGPVQNVATAVAKVGSALSNTPVIAPFARATTTIANAAAKVASMFGWAKPLVLDDPHFVKNMPFANSALTVCKDTNWKIALDPKQELTVDQSLGGVTEDQMTIACIAGRESFLTSFEWSETDPPLIQPIWTSCVTPNLFSEYHGDLDPSHYIRQPTGMAFAVRPFQSWRGKVRFRLEVNASMFHRGKLMIRFDPNIAQITLINSASSQFNQQNILILDIQEAQDLTFEVEWAYPRSWARVRQLDSQEEFDVTPCDLTQFGAGVTAGSLVNDIPMALGEQFPLPPYGIGAIEPIDVNGFITIVPLNTLIQPTTSSPVSVNVYVSCPDLEVNRMGRKGMPETREFDFETESNIIAINPGNDSITDKMFLNHYGERIFSFRSLMKRYTFNGSAKIGNRESNKRLFRTKGGLYPQNCLPVGLPPRPPTGDCLFSYLEPGFLAKRGGYRHRIMHYTVASDIGFCRVSLETQPYSPLGVALGTDPLESPIAIEEIIETDEEFWKGSRAVLDGTLTYHRPTNGGIEFEVPYYSRNLWDFSLGGVAGYFGGNMDFDAENGSWGWNCENLFGTTVGSSCIVQVDSAAAEDFTFLRFQGAPFYTHGYANPEAVGYVPPVTYDLTVDINVIRTSTLSGSFFPIDFLGLNVGNFGYTVTPADIIGLKFRDQSTMIYYEVVAFDVLDMQCVAYTP